MSPKARPKPAAPGVGQELKQARPFRSSAQEALLAVMITSDRLLARLDHELGQAADVTRQQYNVLRILRGAGSEGLATLEIGERMIERTPGITRLLDRLERKGWIERRRSEQDRRQVRCRATRAGLALLARLDPLVDAYDDLPRSVLRDAELRELIRLLDRLRSAFR